MGGFFDGIVDTIGDVAGSLGDTFSDVWDWGSDNLGDIMDIGGVVVDNYARQEEQSNLEDIANKQSDEITRVADHNAALQQHNADVMYENALNARYQTNLAFYNNTRKVDELLAQQTVKTAKAGIAPGEGTAVSVAMKTAAEGQAENRAILYTGRKATEKALSQRDQYLLAKGETLRSAATHVNILEDATENELTALEYSQWSQGISDLFRVGSEEGWWV